MWIVPNGESEPLFKALRDAWQQQGTTTQGLMPRMDSFSASMLNAANAKQCNMCQRMWTGLRSGLALRGQRYPE